MYSQPTKCCEVERGVKGSSSAPSGYFHWLVQSWHSWVLVHLLSVCTRWAETRTHQVRAFIKGALLAEHTPRARVHRVHRMRAKSFAASMENEKLMLKHQTVGTVHEANCIARHQQDATPNPSIERTSTSLAHSAHQVYVPLHGPSRFRPAHVKR
jgi:hypothetical protein